MKAFPSAGLRNIYTMFRGITDGFDGIWKNVISVPHGYSVLEAKLIPFTMMFNRLLFEHMAENRVRITTNTTTLLGSGQFKDYGLVYAIVVNAIGTGSTVTFRDNAGNTLFVLQTTALGIQSLPVGCLVHDCVTAGAVAADIMVLYSDFSGVTDAYFPPME